MEVIQELQYYCEEKNTSGALLLTGDWGSGKTYLINNQFRKNFQEHFAFIQISLFGVSDISTVHKMVKKEYMKHVAKNIELFLKSKPNSAIAKILENINTTEVPLKKALRAIATVSKKIPYAKELVALEYEQLIDVENKIGDKSIVLIFDDLERCDIKISEIFGLINVYCENLTIKTIILANQNKIADSENNSTINYSEIKEKLISRTLYYKPNYEDILKGIIREYKDNSNGVYTNFLISKEIYTNLYKIFILSENKNLRSFKCIIQDFERVYNILKGTQLNDYIKEILFSFAIYMLESKKGERLSDNIYADSNNFKKYGSYRNKKFDFECLKKWISDGVWEENVFQQEIDEKIKAFSPQTALDRIRCNGRLMELEESDIEEEYDLFLSLAYNGELSLNEYVNLIVHYIFAKRMEYALPALDLSKLKDGIEKQKRTLITNLRSPNTHRNILEDESFNDYIELKEIYYLIKNFREKDMQLFGVNKEKYLKSLKDKAGDVYEMENKRLNEFDNEIAIEVLQSFLRENNLSKVVFIRSFKNTWRLTSDKNIAVSLVNFEWLKEQLIASISNGQKNRIETYNINDFVKTIESLICEYTKNER